MEAYFVQTVKVIEINSFNMFKMLLTYIYLMVVAIKRHKCISYDFHYYMPYFESINSTYHTMKIKYPKTKLFMPFIFFDLVSIQTMKIPTGSTEFVPWKDAAAEIVGMMKKVRQESSEGETYLSYSPS